MVRISDTVAWHPLRQSFPGSASINELTKAVQHMTTLLVELISTKELIRTHDAAKRVTNQLLKNYTDVIALEALF